MSESKQLWVTNFDYQIQGGLRSKRVVKNQTITVEGDTWEDAETAVKRHIQMLYRRSHVVINHMAKKEN